MDKLPPISTFNVTTEEAPAKLVPPLKPEFNIDNVSMSLAHYSCKYELPCGLCELTKETCLKKKTK